jgi:hypothetical protein
MAKSTKYIAQNPIVNLNGKSYEVGGTVTGLNADQEKRLLDLGAIATEKDSNVDPTNEDGTVADGSQPDPTADEK